MKLDMWCAIIMDYTHRGMTKPNDRLAALAGIAQALSRYTKHYYTAGLWSMNHFISLLWSLPHREKYLMSAKTNFNVKSNKHIRHEQIIAPSWPWASITAPVWYAGNTAITIDRVCEVKDVQVSGSIDREAGHVTIHGHVRRGYVDAVCPYTIREAVTEIPEMTAPVPAGRMGLENVTFQDRCFHSNEFFLFSEHHRDPNGSVDTASLLRRGSFRFVRGTFRPDEIIDPIQEITFLALGQQHFSAQISTPISSTQPRDPMRVHTLALDRVGDEGRWRHEDEYQSDRLPDWRMYKAGTLIEEKTTVIV